MGWAAGGVYQTKYHKLAAALNDSPECSGLIKLTEHLNANFIQLI